MQKGQTAIIVAAKDGRLDVIKVLLNHGANVSHQSKVKKAQDEIRQFFLFKNIYLLQSEFLARL